MKTGGRGHSASYLSRDGVSWRKGIPGEVSCIFMAKW